MTSSPTIAFVGGGNMAWALALGMADRICSPNQIHIVEINRDTRARWQAQGMHVYDAPGPHLALADIVVLSVKPQNMREVVNSIRPYLTEDTLVVSIAAGIRSDTLAAWLGTPQTPWLKLVRCMPNTPALVGAGASGLAALAGVTAQDRDRVTKIFESVGAVIWVADDAAIDAVTALSGSGPAYVFLFIESLIAGGIAQGLDAAQARALALATLRGATQLAAESNEPPEKLRHNVTSPGGTTAAALAVFEAANLRGLVGDAMAAAAERSRSLAAEAAKEAD
ncbi:MAG: pyrroline-5-carboxylate reductase [Burkholderiaceae bacterium]|nr:pyrroline-5-carboxylate reductase [Burkholderiaceae bacterium]